MGDSKSYTAHDIEKLKQKIATYKDTLTSLKTGSSIDGYLFIKNEFNGFKSKISHLEGLAEIMDEKQSVQIGEYEQQVKQFSVQINSLNKTVEELNQDISLIRNKIKNDTSNDFIEHTNARIDVQDSVIITTNEEKEESFIDETNQSNDQTSISYIPQPNRPPSFMQLQSLVAKANHIEEAPSDETPIASLDFQNKYPEEQQYNNSSFPSTGINPSQLNSVRKRNDPMTSAIHLNKFVIKHVIPIRLTENSNLSLSIATGVSEENEQVAEYSDEANNIAPIERKNAPIAISNEVNEVAPLEGENAPIEISDEVNAVAPIEDENASIEISDEVNAVAPIKGENAPIEISDEVNAVAPIEDENASIEISDEVNAVAPIKGENAPIEISDEVNEVAPIEISDEVNEVALIKGKNTSVEISNEMKRQQHKNKETLWLFNFFRKKH